MYYSTLKQKSNNATENQKVSKLKNDLLKIGPQQHMLPLLVDVLDLVSWLLATACRLFQFQKSTVTMGELKSPYRKKNPTRFVS